MATRMPDPVAQDAHEPRNDEPTERARAHRDSYGGSATAGKSGSGEGDEGGKDAGENEAAQAEPHGNVVDAKGRCGSDQDRGANPRPHEELGLEFLREASSSRRPARRPSQKVEIAIWPFQTGRSRTPFA